MEEEVKIESEVIAEEVAVEASPEVVAEQPAAEVEAVAEQEVINEA